MRRIDTIRRAAKNIRQAKIRTVLTSLAIAVGATTVAVAISMYKGGNAYVENLAGKIGDQGSVTVSRYFDANIDPYAPVKINGSVENTNKEQYEKSLLDNTFSEEDLDKIKAIKGTRNVSGYVDIKPYSVRLDNSQDKFIPNIQPKLDEKIAELSAGKLENNRIEPNKVVVPKAYISAFGAKDANELIGKKVIFEYKRDNNSINEKSFKIVAVDAGKTETAFNYNNSFLLNSSDTVEIARNLSSNKIRYSIIKANVNDNKTPTQLKNEISNLDGGKYFTVATFEDDKAIVQQAISIASLGLAGFGFLTILASVFGIINTQYISVLERTSQIGLMKSLGMRKSEVSRLFRYEAALIGLFGGLIGIAIAYGVTFLNPLINSLFIRSGGAEGKVDLLQVDFGAWAILVLVLMVVSIMSGYLPARKAAKMNPIDALRTE